MSSPRFERLPLPSIVAQHVDEAAHLRRVRSVLLRAPHVGLRQLATLDERIAAHLDGISVAGATGAWLAQAALERVGVGETFVAAVVALEAGDASAFGALLALAEALPDARRGIVSAMGWVSPSVLQGTVHDLLSSKAAWRRALGFDACRLHRVDPGARLDAALDDVDALVREHALPLAGSLGRTERAPRCAASRSDDRPAVALAALGAMLRLGDRGVALDGLCVLACDHGAQTGRRLAAIRLVAHAAELPVLHGVLAVVREAPGRRLEAVRAAGWAGDPADVPWLLSLLDAPETARAAAEAVALVVGCDLGRLALQPAAPHDGEERDDETQDEDAELPWPDPAALAAWWRARAGEFRPGVRHLLGRPRTADVCAETLRFGLQRQRRVAALAGALLAPGMPAFDVSAPGWRQQRALGLFDA